MRRRWRIALWLLLVLALYAVAVVLAMDVVSARPRLERWYAWLAVAAAAALAAAAGDHRARAVAGRETGAGKGGPVHA